MKRNSLATVGELQLGDRFYKKADKKKKIWELRKVWLNQMECIDPGIAPGHQERHSKKFKNSTEVVFIRHTIPIPGEEIFIENLQVGDVFFRPEDVVNEYVVQEIGHDFYKVRKCSEAAPIMAGRLSTVIFVRHKGQAIA